MNSGYAEYRVYMLNQRFIPLTEKEWVMMNSLFDKADKIASKILDEMGD